jgi:DnaJ homolog subfamily C member 3
MADVIEAERFYKEAQKAEKWGDYQACIEAAGSALGVGTGLASLWQLRARCAVAIGDTEGAVGDLTFYPGFPC